jgi:ligand-binding sensor domain-containing protein
VKDGLPSSTTYSITQDAQSFIWIGSEAGLVRFDGTNFRVFTTQDGLPDNEVLGVSYNKRMSKLWIVTYTSGACYYANNKIYSKRNDKALNVIEVDEGDYINTNRKAYKNQYLFAGRRFYQYTNTGVRRLEDSKGEVFQANEWNDSMLDASRGLTQVKNDTETCGGLNIYKYGKLVDFFPIRDIHPGQSHGSFWVDNKFILSANNKLEFFTKGTDGRYTGYAEKITGMPEMATCIERVGGEYYVSFVNRGIYALDTSLRYPFRQIWAGVATGFCTDNKGDVWITTKDDGVYVLINSGIKNYMTGMGAMHDNLSALAVNPSGKLVYGNSMGEIFAMDSGKSTKIATSLSKSTERVRGIVFAKKDLYFITDGSLFSYEFDKKKLNGIPTIAGGPKSLIYSERKNTLYVGMIGGVLEMKDLDTTGRTEYKIYKRVTSLCEDRDGRMYLGSIDRIYEYKDHTIIAPTDADARLRLRTMSICATDRLVWIGTAL